MFDFVSLSCYGLLTNRYGLSCFKLKIKIILDSFSKKSWKRSKVRLHPEFYEAKNSWSESNERETNTHAKGSTNWSNKSNNVKNIPFSLRKRHARRSTLKLDLKCFVAQFFHIVIPSCLSSVLNDMARSLL